MNFKRIGNYIRQADNRNTDISVTLLRGVSTTKQLIESVANMSGVSLHSYKIVDKGQFVYVSDTSRRGDKIAIALNDEAPCIVSSIYTVFEVIDENQLLPEYLFMWFNRAEFDRYARFHSWGSARETFDWDTLCDVEIPIPEIGEQQKYVALYKGLLNNQKSYNRSLADLQLICDTYLENLINTEKSKTLGEYIEQSEERNSDLQVTFLQGVSTSKVLIETKANVNGLEFSNYKVVRTGEFVYVADTSRRGDKIALAMNSAEPCIVSGIYTVFRVTKPKELLPEYLYLWFARPEFDRYARFHSWGSARETFDWADMCNVKLPIPDIKVQEAIVTIYHTLETRKRINEQLKNTIKPLCPVLMKGVVESMKPELEKV
ncbi:MAG: restriction endonuclease subunit S [Bacteroidota bacterium]|jgi:type I restriction enzyme S subunit|nr:restriction endonuclease subunit S [Flammeovirgaceae bacterium]